MEQPENSRRRRSDTLASPQEYTRIVRLCATITGNKDVAEDLAQETFLEAWRHQHELREIDKQSQWLSGIARNVCLRWMRKSGRDQQHLIYLTQVKATHELELPTFEESLMDDFDVEFELERKELITLLDHTLELLPPETRAVLIKRFVEESPIAEVAAQLGTNAGAVAMRLQRGKLIMRRILVQQMPDEFDTYTLQTDNEGWKQTRIWCSLCGQHRLLGLLIPSAGSIELRCPGCFSNRSVVYSNSLYPALLRGVKSYKIALDRLSSWAHSYYNSALHDGTVPCFGCGQPVHPLLFSPDEAPRWLRNGDRHGVRIVCSRPHCAALAQSYLETLVLFLPEIQQFRRRHPRIRTLPEREIEVDGRPSLVTTFESVTDTAHISIISAKDNYATLHIYEGKQ